MEIMELEEKLRQLCAAHRVNPAELGKAIGGVSRTTMYNWFNGLGRPDLRSALKIARYFNISLEYLADDAADEMPAPSDLTPDEVSILKLYRALKLDGLDEVETMRRMTSSRAAQHRTPAALAGQSAPASPSVPIRPPSRDAISPPRDLKTGEILQPEGGRRKKSS